MFPLIAFIFLPIFIFCSEFLDKKTSSVDKGIESMLIIDASSPINKSKLDFNSFFMMPSGFSYLMVSPRMNVCFNGDFGTSLGIGFRRSFNNMVIGHHIFYDYSLQFPDSFHQIGTSLEFINPNYDFRLNFYNPIKNPRREIHANKWVEAESLWKFDDFCVGLSPSYNFKTSKAAIKPKIILPLKYVVLETGIHISQDVLENSAYFSMGIPLYSLGQRPVSRCSSIKVSNFGEPSISNRLKKKVKNRHQEKICKESAIQEIVPSSNTDLSQLKFQERADIM